MRLSPELCSSAAALFALLTVFCAVPARAEASPHRIAQSGPPPAQPVPPSTQRGLELRTDAGGNLWVETPAYTWNVTGGTSIAAGGATWAAAGAPGSTVLDGLFLAAPPGAPTTRRIFYALPDGALVYLERAVPGAGPEGAVEGVELTLRAGDGLVRVAHRWQGPNPPGDAQLAGLPVALPPSAQQAAGAVAPAAAADAPLPYTAGYDAATGQGVALLAPPAAGPAAASTPAAPRCVRSYPSSEPQAHDPCFMQGFYLPGREIGADLLLFYAGDALEPILHAAAALRRALPDLDVAYIERLPRYDYSANPNAPAPGAPVTFRAHVANRGGRDALPFRYAWWIDGAYAAGGGHPGLAPGQTATLEYAWAFGAGNHTVELALDVDGLIAEVSEANNWLNDRSNGLALGLWVEQSVYDYFNQHQAGLGTGSVSWDDWAQRQVRIWNRLFADAVHPLTPEGVLDRVRLDKVTIVPDGALPQGIPSNRPAPDDETVDMMWGFVSELVGASGSHPGTEPLYLEWTSAQLFEPSLLHELSHARYLLDLYGLNVYFPATALARAVDAAERSLTVRDDVGSRVDFPLPVYLAVDGELIVCNEKLDAVLYDCVRGVEGTAARAHARGTPVMQAAIRVQDGAGNLAVGSPALPLVTWWSDHVYMNRYPDDLMSNHLSETLMLGEHSAYAMNRIAGQRPRCGNYNAPCNVGEYANDIPAQNVLRILGEDGAPLSDARVELFRARPNPGWWYAKLFLAAPDRVYHADDSGEVELGAFPFGAQPPIRHGYGFSNADLLLRVTHGSRTFYRFLEVTEANEAFWRGDRERALYVIEAAFPALCFLPAVAGR